MGLEITLDEQDTVRQHPGTVFEAANYLFANP